MAATLSATGAVDAALLSLTSPGRWSHADQPASTLGLPPAFDAYLLQYNPFSFGHWGVAPWLPLVWWGLRRHAPTRMVMTIHEAYVPLVGWRNTATGLWQRTQLNALLKSSDAVIATCRERADQLAYSETPLSISYVPVGSNLDAVTEETKRVELRQHLGGPRGRPVIATFGNAHPSRLLSHIERAVSSLAQALGELVCLNLGASPPALSAPMGVEVVRPGPLGAQELSLYLACADLVLLPFTCGAITNKTTLMAALRLGRPVLSTRGRATDPVLLDPGLELVDVADAHGYAAAAVALMRDHAARDALGRNGRALYERAFSWAVIAEQTLRVLGLSAFEAIDGRPVGLEVALDDRVP